MQRMKKSIYSPEQKKLRRLLRQVRQGAGLRQADLARILGKHQTFVSNYERGGRTLDLLEVRQVCKAVGISLGEFVRRFEESLR
jgi:transcriptional regulator with XRE-family HTH domain